MDFPNYLLEEEEGIDIRKWLYRIYEHWKLFLFFIFISLLLAFAYNFLSSKEFQLKTKILIKENPNPLDKQNLVRVSLNSDPYRLDNEIGILSSTSVRKRALQQLDFFIEYYRHESFRRIELYRNTPFIVVYDTNYIQPINLEFNIKYLTDSLLIIEAEGEEVTLYNYSSWQNKGEIHHINFSDTIRIGDTLSNQFFRFAIQSNPHLYSADYKNYDYSFSFRSLLDLSNKYSNIELDIPKGSSIITISLEHTNPVKSARYLNKLTDIYLQKGIERENTIAQRTIDFIDLQLSTLVDSLRMSEDKLQDFRSQNRIVDIDIQAQKAYERQSELERQRAELIMQKRYLKYLDESLQNKTIRTEELISPTTMGIDDAVLNNLVLELVRLNNERTELTLNTRKNTPYVESLDSRINSLINKLSETVDNILNATNISLNEVETQEGQISSVLEGIPRDQRELLSFQRKFELNDEIYTYLLTRRSEMQIKKASNLPANEILEEANVSEAKLVSPNKKLSFILALFLGVLFPFGFVYLRVTLNNKIDSPEDIKTLTDTPLIGTIIQNEDVKIPAVYTEPTSILAESFRMLRANLQFLLSEDQTPVIIVSSAMKGEGKSFISINLAAVCASYDKKVCIIDLDLRRPRLANYLDINTEEGISNLLIGRSNLKDIKHSVCNKLFDFIPSGPIPPNPSELVASERLKQTIEELKKEYDTIIIDTPPIGMVSDALLLSRHASHFMLVLRHNYTHKHNIEHLIEEMSRNKVKGMHLVYNDLPVNKKGYYKYGYRYGYYYAENQKSFWEKLFRI